METHTGALKAYPEAKRVGFGEMEVTLEPCRPVLGDKDSSRALRYTGALEINLGVRTGVVIFAEEHETSVAEPEPPEPYNFDPRRTGTEPFPCSRFRFRFLLHKKYQNKSTLTGHWLTHA
jgi:hypothetical protein